MGGAGKDSHHSTMIMVSLLLRGWVGMVSVVSTVNAIMCFIHKDYPRERIYNKDNSQGLYTVHACTYVHVWLWMLCYILCHVATALAARLFGVWTLLSSAIRMIFAISPSSSSR